MARVIDGTVHKETRGSRSKPPKRGVAVVAGADTRGGRQETDERGSQEKKTDGDAKVYGTVNISKESQNITVQS